MATRSPSAPSFSAPSNHLLFLRPLSMRVGPKFPSRVLDRPAITCRLNPSSDGELVYELHHSHRRRVGSFPVYVTLPADAVGPTAQTMRRKKAMAQSFRALAAAGVEGVVMEVWWGLVEREFPRIYDWRGYLEIVLLAKRFGLKVRAMMAFHRCGSDPADPSWLITISKFHLPRSPPSFFLVKFYALLLIVAIKLKISTSLDILNKT